LRKDQKGLSTRFSKPGEDKWDGVDATPGVSGGVVIRPSLATFDCRIHRRYDGGDHIILVGEVLALESAAICEPLIYFRSDYREIAGSTSALSTV
jgi:3-hydroxy-9,10-secoandrosta-1,3,5(10)-triene-9,17-dione monooxygenase reductase component